MARLLLRQTPCDSPDGVMAFGCAAINLIVRGAAAGGERCSSEVRDDGTSVLLQADMAGHLEAAPGLLTECRGTEPSAHCCVAADPELLIECRGQSVQRSREGAAHSPPKGHRGSRVFLAVAPRARQRVPRTRHSCEVLRRASSLANHKQAS